MRVTSVKFLGIGLITALALGFSAPQSHSEITVTSGVTPTKTDADTKTETGGKNHAGLGKSNWVQCWQHGIKIIDEKDIFDIRLQKLISRDDLGLRGQDSKHGSVFVVPLDGDSTCLIKPLR